MEKRKTEKRLPELYRKKEECCGCSACYAACPMSGPGRPGAEDQDSEDREYTGAITMMPDEEGFLYPVLDASACIRCYQCMDVCPVRAEKAFR